ncbi:hypothetical protein P5673_020103 [Acropora cervicornis]|uniref:Uncharacterized protein n=1 Tax=Acropora cervicornis TaxID=6130 RepID=A0AAD9QAI0_ACRCE|nr:hypothetical protein P5673_020103 [Acropora cervicornis]
MSTLKVFLSIPGVIFPKLTVFHLYSAANAPQKGRTMTYSRRTHSVDTTGFASNRRCIHNSSITEESSLAPSKATKFVQSFITIKLNPFSDSENCGAKSAIKSSNSAIDFLKGAPNTKGISIACMTPVIQSGNTV